MLLRPPVMDPAAAYPKLTTLRTGLRAGDWAACRAVLDSAEPVERTELIRSASDASGVEPLLRQVLDRDPDDSTAAAVLGSHLVHVGWEIRSSYRARHVSRKQFQAFHEKLRQAEHVLYPATERHPDDPALWVIRLTVARGLELGQDEARRRYDRLAEIDPQHLPGQLQLLQQLCPKWGGSWPAVWDFVGRVAGTAPFGAHNHMVIAEAHIEEATDDDWTSARRRLSVAGVQAVIKEAANRSVWHPEFRRSHGWVLVLNTFAAAFSLGGDLRSAKSMFRMLGDFGSEYPWGSLAPSPASTIWLHRLRTAFVRES
ncbi:hypothetical protein [Actinoplanes sp. NPDC026670]|uniref:tetratricopeptide repeat protein n=1 Tax=Actinoplanes sp. NPDC026670 TaxID=3154700 RepID=UPI0033F783C7